MNWPQTTITTNYNYNYKQDSVSISIYLLSRLTITNTLILTNTNITKTITTTTISILYLSIYIHKPQTLNNIIYYNLYNYIIIYYFIIIIKPQSINKNKGKEENVCTYQSGLITYVTKRENWVTRGSPQGPTLTACQVTASQQAAGGRDTRTNEFRFTDGDVPG